MLRSSEYSQSASLSAHKKEFCLQDSPPAAGRSSDSILYIYFHFQTFFRADSTKQKYLEQVTELSGSATCSGYFYFCVISVYTSLFFNFRSNSKTSFLHNSIASLQVSTSSPSISMLSSPGYLVEK